MRTIYMPKKGFSEVELKDLAKAWGAISLAFAIAFSGGLAFTNQFFMVLLASALTVGLGFLGHEMAHRYVARKYHCWAEFRADNRMLIIAIIVSFLGFIFAAPGAVVIQGHVTKERNGKISAAGPLANILFALAFFLIGFVTSGSLAVVAMYGMKINGWLAAFNCIPFGPLDGSKIFAWNKTVGGLLLVGGLLFALA